MEVCGLTFELNELSGLWKHELLYLDDRVQATSRELHKQSPCYSSTKLGLQKAREEAVRALARSVILGLTHEVEGLQASCKALGGVYGPPISELQRGGLWKVTISQMTAHPYDGPLSTFGLGATRAEAFEQAKEDFLNTVQRQIAWRKHLLAMWTPVLGS